MTAPQLRAVRLGAAAGDAAHTPRCSVGLLTWNAGPELAATLRALQAQDEPAFELLWLDNGSAGDYAAVLAEFPALPAPARNPRNVGFAEGHNQLIEACRTPYYLALNQDAALAPDYLRLLCDWLDREPDLALVSGLTVLAGRAPARLDFAGLAWPRLRHPFGLGHYAPVPPRPPAFRRASSVMGAAALLRVAACRAASHPAREVFAADFFAYHEELELSQRLARAGFGCGVAGAARASHVSGTSGGRKHPFIQMKIFSNHWMITLRNDPLGLIVRELPWLLWGELRWWLPRYLRAPGPFVRALADAVRRARTARTVYHALERRHGPTAARLRAVRALARRELADPALWRGPVE